MSDIESSSSDSQSKEDEVQQKHSVFSNPIISDDDEIDNNNKQSYDNHQMISEEEAVPQQTTSDFLKEESISITLQLAQKLQNKAMLLKETNETRKAATSSLIDNHSISSKRKLNTETDSIQSRNDNSKIRKKMDNRKKYVKRKTVSSSESESENTNVKRRIVDKNKIKRKTISSDSESTNVKRRVGNNNEIEETQPFYEREEAQPLQPLREIERGLEGAQPLQSILSSSDSDDNDALATLNKKIVGRSIHGEEEYYDKIKKDHIQAGSPPCWACETKNYKGKDSKPFVDMQYIIDDYSAPTLKDHIERIHEGHNVIFVEFHKKKKTQLAVWTKYSKMEHILLHDVTPEKTQKNNQRSLNIQLRNLEEKHLRFNFKGTPTEGINYRATKEWRDLDSVNMKYLQARKK